MSTIQESTAQRQNELTPKEDLSSYIGQWVAVRDGRIVANSLEFEKLYNDPKVRSDDGFMHVDDPESGYFF